MNVIIRDLDQTCVHFEAAVQRVPPGPRQITEAEEAMLVL
jgi:hypothetical protein